MKHTCNEFWDFTYLEIRHISRVATKAVLCQKNMVFDLLHHSDLLDLP